MFIRVRHIGLVLAGIAVAWALGSCSDGSCTVGACSRVQEARRVVAEADSLRVAGVTYSDSAAMAQAASSLEWVRAFYPTDYAHANYYLGRILRNSGDHPAAMEAFLRVTHSRTSDHTIKGRAYSNIGNMCRLAAEHEIACEIYLKAADEFCKAQDTLNYCYVTNSRAYECAEMGEKETAFSILREIEAFSTNNSIGSRIQETRAEACYKVGQFDSALYYISQTIHPHSKEPSCLLIRAQAYSCLQIKDSAVYYAQLAAASTKSWFDLNNAYYILANDNDSCNKKDVLQIAGERSDVQKLIEIRQGQLSQAVQLLEQDMNRKPNLGWLVGTFFTLIIVGISLRLYFVRKRKKHELVSQQVDALIQKKDTLSEQTLQMEQRQAEHRNMKLQEIEQICAAIHHSHDWKKELHWDNFNELCEVINSQFFFLADKLKATCPLDEKEIRLCILVFLDMFTLKEIAALLNYSEKGIRTYKSRINKKVGNNGKDLRFFLVELAILSPENR